MAAVHFLFELIKIALLSAVYGSIIFFMVRWAYSSKVKNAKPTWQRCFSIIYVILFIFMFTYWGNHGLGDESFIPIPHHRLVNNQMKQLI